MSSSDSPTVHLISTCTVKPSPSPPAATHCHLTPWDIILLVPNYIQKGLLFTNLPSSLTAHGIIHRLKTSLAAALHHFYPLAGRLVSEPQPDGGGMFVYIACNGEGAEFVHAVAENTTAADVLAPLSDVPSFVKSFFPYDDDDAITHDVHSLPLLAVQLTELADGVFVACTFNHVVGDGTAYWHFFNAWAELARAGAEDGDCIAVSRPPVHDRWFIDGVGKPPIRLPFSHSDEFIELFARHPPLRDRMFHFSPESVAKLKARANEECRRGFSTDQAAVPTIISSLQALSALMWMSITRARGIPADEETSCLMAIQDRGRLLPPLSPDYFGNVMLSIRDTTTAGELMANGLGAAALALNRAVAGHNDNGIRRLLRGWHERPRVYKPSTFDKNSVLMGSSPRFDMYGCDFGWGKAVAVRSGRANKFDGMVASYPGREGKGSIDLEVCLLPEYMSALLSDEEFMATVSVPAGV